VLDISDLHAGYGRKRVLHGINLRVGKREVVALLGHNGAGKSTLLETIFGFVAIEQGRILLDGSDISSEPAHGRIRRGIGYVGQGAPVFSRLTVRDNLLMGGNPIADRNEVTDRVKRIEQLFPSLAERRNLRAGSLSGGERQMLALGMQFVASPSMLILDEPSGGMSPFMVDKMYAAIDAIIRDLHSSLLLVEQDVDRALGLADRVYVLANGRMKYEGSAQAVRDPAERARILIGL
jgi:branched-chain amino acid transport system ATP-binding protein